MWATQVHGVYTRATRYRAVHVATRVRARRRFEAEVLALCMPFVAAPTAEVPHAALCRRIQKYLPTPDLENRPRS